MTATQGTHHIIHLI